MKKEISCAFRDGGSRNGEFSGWWGEETLLTDGASAFLQVVTPASDGVFGEGLPRLGSRFQEALEHLFVFLF